MASTHRARRLGAISVSVAAAAASLGLATAASARTTSVTSWLSTATSAARTGSAALLGAAPPEQRLQIDVALPARDPAAEKTALKAMYTPGSATYHQFLSPAQWAARYAPTAAQVNAVTSYLRQEGFTGISVQPDQLLVTATGTVGSAEQAFDTAISRFSAGGRTFLANTTAAKVPGSLSGDVLAVLGLNTMQMPAPHPATRTASSGSADPFIALPPKDFQRTYDAGGTPAGQRTSIALFTEGNLTQVYKDLRTAESAYGLPKVPVTQVNVGPQSGDTSGLDEWDMDTQTSTAMATTVNHLYLYNTGSLADASIVPDIAAFVNQDKARAMSASIGGCDIGPYLDGSLVTTDEITEQGAMQGQTLFASSGDNGAGCAYVASVGAPTVPPGTNWPASGEYTTAVGGTSLLTDSSGNRKTELGWIGSGGGISEDEVPGWWTQDSDPGYAASDVTGGRAVPDVALDADPNTFTAASVYVSGKATGVGGTSLASPLMLGAWARLESAHSNSLGLASIGFYRLYDKVNPGTSVAGAAVVPSALPQPVPGFTDITAGDNGPYPAKPGYDLVTGIGAPDIAALSKRLG